MADLAPILAGSRFPRLRHLALRNSDIQDEIAAALARPVVAGLATLDLSMGTLGDEGAEALLGGQPLTHLRKLDLHHNFLSEAMRERILATLGPAGVKVDLSETEGREDRGRRHGVALHRGGGVGGVDDVALPEHHRCRLTVVGFSGNRRVTLFQDAVRAAGLPAAREVSWLDVLGGRAELRAGETVRIDSPGEDPEVEKLLRGADDLTRVEGTGRWYERFTTAVRGLGQAATAVGADLLDAPEELAVLFDKRPATPCWTRREYGFPRRPPPARDLRPCRAGTTYGP